MKKTVIYIRQSLDQTMQKNSKDLQMSKCLKFAQARSWIVHECIDEGDKSARITTIEERPAIKRLLYDAEQGNVERLIVYKRDRLARNVEQYLEILTCLQKAGVDIYFSAENEPPIIKGHIGEFVEVMLAGLAQQEGENIHRRQIESKQYLAAKGLKVGGGVPYGYELANKVLAKKADEENIINLIFTKFNEHWHPEISLKDIVYIMKEKTPELNDYDLKTDDIKKRIPHEIYKGVLVQRVGGVEYRFENIAWRMVEPEVWIEANEKLKCTSPKLFLSENKELYTPLLEDKICCNDCSVGDVKVFFCAKKLYYRCKSCERALPIKRFDEYVVTEIIKMLKNWAEENFDVLKSFIKERFLEFRLTEEKELKRDIITLENRIFESIKMTVLNKDSAEDASALVQSYVHKHQKLRALQDSIYSLETIMSGMRGFKRIEEMNVENLEDKEKQLLVETIDQVIYAEEHLYFQYKDKRGS